jgi:phosphate-selective porin OprO/OprP
MPRIHGRGFRGFMAADFADTADSWPRISRIPQIHGRGFRGYRGFMRPRISRIPRIHAAADFADIADSWPRISRIPQIHGRGFRGYRGFMAADFADTADSWPRISRIPQIHAAADFADTADSWPRISRIPQIHGRGFRGYRGFMRPRISRMRRIHAAADFANTRGWRRMQPKRKWPMVDGRWFRHLPFTIVHPIVLLMLVALAIARPGAAQSAAMASARLAAPVAAAIRYRPPASLRAGNGFRADFRVRLHADFRRFSPELPLDDGTFRFRRARVGVEGRVLDDIEYELDYETRDDAQPWRNVFVNLRRWRAAEIRVGRFKVPYGREQLTGVFNINFIERALLANQVAPGRDTGVMLHGRVAHDAVRYQTAVFRHDGDNTRVGGERVGDALWAGRVLVTPWAHGPKLFRTVEGGFAATAGNIKEGLNGIRGRTLSGYEYSEAVYVKGRRTRMNIEGGWSPGPFGIDAEYVRLLDQRNGQGIGDVDLPDALAQGWSISGSWVLTGERKADGVEPKRRFLQEGVGAVELAARLETLRFGSRDTGGEEPFANPRSANLLPNRDRILTLGVNWYLNPFARVIVNGTREDIRDPERSPIVGRTRFWGAACRLQFVL